MGSPLVYGHRGARAGLPENSIAAFQYAIDAGADAIELDVVVTLDNQLVVCHDPVLLRRKCAGGTGTRVIRKMTLADLSQWRCGGAPIPTLDQVLALAARGSFLFNIEIKTHPRYTPPAAEYAALVADAIRLRGLEARTLVQSFNFKVLDAVRRIAPGIRRGLLFEGLRRRSLLRVAVELGASNLSPYHRLVSKRLVAAAHDAGLTVVPWTANGPRQWNRMIDAGVDGIITDDPAGLLRFLQERGLR